MAVLGGVSEQQPVGRDTGDLVVLPRDAGGHWHRGSGGLLRGGRVRSNAAGLGQLHQRDGRTWETASLPSGIAYSHFTARSVQNNIKPVSFTGGEVRSIRNGSAANTGGGMLCATHLYGEKVAGQTPDDVIYIDHDTPRASSSPHRRTSGTSRSGTTVVRQFRVKNTSATKTANTINVQCNDADFAISTDGIDVGRDDQHRLAGGRRAVGHDVRPLHDAGPRQPPRSALRPDRDHRRELHVGGGLELALANATAVAVATATWTTVTASPETGRSRSSGSRLKCDDAAVAFEARMAINGVTTIAGVAALAGSSASDLRRADDDPEHPVLRRPGPPRGGRQQGLHRHALRGSIVTRPRRPMPAAARLREARRHAPRDAGGEHEHRDPHAQARPRSAARRSTTTFWLDRIGTFTSPALVTSAGVNGIGGRRRLLARPRRRATAAGTGERARPRRSAGRSA